MSATIWVEAEAFGSWLAGSLMRKGSLGRFFWPAPHPLPKLSEDSKGVNKLLAILKLLHMDAG